MIITGEMIDDTTIIVHKPSDIGRLYSKSNFGTMIRGQHLKLDLLETIFLVGENKLQVTHGNQRVSIEQLVSTAAQTLPNFETQYLLFRDLRNRGIMVKPCEKKLPFTFQDDSRKKTETTKKPFITCYSERDSFDIESTKKMIQTSKQNNRVLWYAIVDEEGDITYYEITAVSFQAEPHTEQLQKTKGLLLNNRVIIFDKQQSKTFLNEGFYGKPFSEDYLQLSFVESLYLMQQGYLNLHSIKQYTLSKKELIRFIKEKQPDIDLKLNVYSDLKHHGLLVKTGFKFGAHFRVYTQKPEKTHAEYLVHVVEKNFKSIWSEISRAVRLAHSVNKEIIFAQVNENSIDYIRLGRLKP